MKRHAVLFMVMCAVLCSSIAYAQSTPQSSTWGHIKAMYGVKDEGVSMAPRLAPPASHDWSNNVLSEEFYTMSTSRSGCGSTYKPSLYGSTWCMSDAGWNYSSTDSHALSVVTGIIGSSNVGSLGLWTAYDYADKRNESYQQGGYCKFFVDLVLYRCSYGYGSGYHFILPSGYYYATHSTREAGVGWVLQIPSSTGPHTALVAAVYSGGLDVVDSNWIGSYALGRHYMDWGYLDSKGYKAYCPWTDGYSNNNQGFTTQ